MNIQAKLTITYITLLSIGVVVISAYAILSIRSFLLEEAIQKFESDAFTFAQALQEEGSNEDLYAEAEFVSDLTGYTISLFDSVGMLLVTAPESATSLNPEELIEKVLQEELDAERWVIINDPESEVLFSWHKLDTNISDVRYLKISQLKDDLYGAESSIRHLIYGAMISSIIVVVIVSFFFARYLARPITQLKEAALEIAGGNLDHEINVYRNDEFGTLAESVNRMAAKLKQDYEQLKTLNEKQNQFFADIAHEVRNPLHTISGAMEMLQVPNLPEQKKEQYMATAQKQVERVVRLFEDIKSLQRYDMDESFIHKSKFDISLLISEVVSTYKPIANEKGLQLEVTCSDKSFVEADHDKMEQVLDNLVSNAIKYTTEGSIEVGCERERDSVTISVKDTGIGIGEEHLDRLFDRFYRTDKARSRDKGGTGLGLAVVKGILSAHHKEIKVESVPGKGSRFHFTMDVLD
ncbi:MAG: HAMP domain-containing histidine kinase [Balneolales bacterium]|nr:HAMP domain-containing histidine kinase [Balneolales bacterium]